MDKDFYYYLEVHKTELDKILEYINIKLTKKLKERVMLDSIDINEYIITICEEYKKLACIENSILEEKRIKDFEYIDESGVLREGFHLQALTIKLKELDFAYSGFRDKDMIQKLGMQIVKRSNISLERILNEIPADKLENFYEMLIKSDRSVIRNDIRRYVERNLYQFFPIIPSNIYNENEKIEYAFNNYLDLVFNNPLQKNYLNFIRENSIKDHQVKTETFDLNHPEAITHIKKMLMEDEKTKILETNLDISNLITKYINFKNPSKTVKKRQNQSLKLFKEYMNGDGKEFKSKKIEDLISSHVFEFEELVSEATPKIHKELKNLNLFKLVEYRKSVNGLRYSNETLSMFDHDIKDFWKFLSSIIDTKLNKDLFNNFNTLYNVTNKKAKENRNDRQIRLFTNQELQIYINKVYDQANIKRILLSSPQNFYSFFFALMLGTRIGEFSYIKLSDIKVQDINNQRIYYIYLNEDDMLQSLKNENAHRNLPIPEPLIKLGFLNYVKLRIKNQKKWLWNIPASGYGSISTFHQRNIRKLFPNVADIEENRIKGENVIQFRSLRKNFSEYIFSNKSGPYYTEQNAKRLIGHDERTSSGTYLGRIEPLVGKSILDELKDYSLDLTTLYDLVGNYYKNIVKDLDIHDKNDYMLKSKVKPKRSRKIK
ncbi:site-specific integrase [Aliarcobacter butzleri]|uniref:hypothetical protein n=1 Tax=Aliarcobacter butzleri TaxID=28197 RepID=UPI002B252627|nr:hypothetical protein [Aliarcobacter butzleri]